MPYHLFITNKNYSSWSLRPWLLMRELGIPFVEEFRPLTSGSFRQPQWHAFSPVPHVPCLHVVPDSPSPSSSSSSTPTSPDTADATQPQSRTQTPTQTSTQTQTPTSPETIILWESLAITDFLAEQHPSKPIWPPLNTNNLAARAWARCAVVEMCTSFAALRQEMGMCVGVRVAIAPEAYSEALVRDLKRVDELWTEGLRRFGGPFLAGRKFGAVDAFFAPVVLRVLTYLPSSEVESDGVGVRERFPGEEARGYVVLMLGLEGVREWVRDAVAETGREVLHDGESFGGVGRRLVVDLRAT